MKCSEVILKVTDFPEKSFYELPLWGEPLLGKLIKLYAKEKRRNKISGVTSSRRPRDFLFKMLGERVFKKQLEEKVKHIIECPFCFFFSF